MLGADTDQMAKKKSKAAKVKPPRLYRDTSTGRFVTKKYAKKNPKETVKVPRTVVASDDA